ncbi:MAG TPA: hypothetical protein VEL47_02220 [Myxococcota bacterium]|nr:hypothetical protein [Myxococcota bacterium]
MYRRLWLLPITIAILLAISLNAQTDMEKANALFAERESNVKSISAAKEIYVKIIKSNKMSLATRGEALDKYARLAVYEGELARKKFGTSKKKSKAIFEQCMNATEHLSADKIGVVVAEYAYWRAVCIGLWAAHTNGAEILIHMKRIDEMVALMEQGVQDFKAFDNYGFNRIQAGFYSRSKALKLRGYYHPEKSWELVNEAIYHNPYVYINYLLKAEIEVALKNKYQAIQTLEQAINDLEGQLKNMPADLLPENKIYLERMEKMLSDLS